MIINHMCLHTTTQSQSYIMEIILATNNICPQNYCLIVDNFCWFLNYELRLFYILVWCVRLFLLFSCSVNRCPCLTHRFYAQQLLKQITQKTCPSPSPKKFPCSFPRFPHKITISSTIAIKIIISLLKSGFHTV